jgi:hypothetical protein
MIGGNLDGKVGTISDKETIGATDSLGLHEEEERRRSTIGKDSHKKIFTVITRNVLYGPATVVK